MNYISAIKLLLITIYIKVVFFFVCFFYQDKESVFLLLFVYKNLFIHI